MKIAATVVALPISFGTALRRAGAGLAVLLAVAAPSSGTWSIVVVDTATGEVCVASATCITSLNLEQKLPVIAIGVGAGAAQAQIDQSGALKTEMWLGLLHAKTPAEILAMLQTGDGAFQSRQYGIVNMVDAPLTFTGSACYDAASGVTGTSGTLRYAIQGNILTGDVVVTAAETALLQTPGDLGQRVMAAMEAARALGGDGRCSCSVSAPTSCGAPPPSFTKSAHIGFVIVARVGDVAAPCQSTQGCALGQYYLNLNVFGVDGAAADPDPVFQLQAKYDTWRQGKVGHPDHVLTQVVPSAQSLVADGQDALTVTVMPHDVDGTALSGLSGVLSIVQVAGPPGLIPGGSLAVSGVAPFSFPVAAGTTAGTGRFALTVDDGTVAARLFPDLEVRVDPLAPLHGGFDEVSASAAVDVPFVLNLGGGQAGQPYVLLASAAGTSPGIGLGGGVELPLVADAFTLLSFQAAGGPFLPGSAGVLDANGRATARLVAPPLALGFLVGGHLDWAAAILAPQPAATNAVGFDVAP